MSSRRSRFGRSLIVSINALLTEHPASVGESYWQHLRSAWSFGFGLLFAGGACLVHGLLPFALVRTASTRVAMLYERMVRNR